jgi:hypothetical protein
MIDLVAGGAWTGQTSLSGRAGAISNQKETPTILSDCWGFSLILVAGTGFEPVTFRL